jgi:hypothetical protein
MFEGTLNGRPIRDWKHTDAPAGTAPHRPVLGTPVSEEALQRLRELTATKWATKHIVVLEPVIVPPPIWAPRPARIEEVPKSLDSMRELAEGYGWDTEPPTYFRTAKEVDFCVLRGTRADLAFVACWKAGKFEEAFRVGKGLTERVGSNSVKDWIRTRDERCATCGRSSMTHDDEECGADGRSNA